MKEMRLTRYELAQLLKAENNEGESLIEELCNENGGMNAINEKLLVKGYGYDYTDDGGYYFWMPSTSALVEVFKEDGIKLFWFNVPEEKVHVVLEAREASKRWRLKGRLTRMWGKTRLLDGKRYERYFGRKPYGLTASYGFVK